MTKIDPRVKDVLILLGAGTFLTASLIMPGLPIVLKPYFSHKRKNEEKEWEKFNLFRLRQVIKRLEKQNDVEIIEDTVKITKKGRQKLLKFDLERMELKRKTDGKWRLIIFDVTEKRRTARDLLRRKLKEWDFIQFQKSVWGTPFICEEEIEYLKYIFDIDREVQVLKVSGMEYKEEYKKYFGL